MSKRSRKKQMNELSREWSAADIQALRQHLGLTQSEMADELQVRQQTISDWEQSLHAPHRSTQKMLSMIAERAGFTYTTDSPAPAAADPPEA